ncbi:MAG: DNA photolyase family protein [Thiohalocapsa sp.]|uniref:cryptochrome/photolyase family protein n=1 Tax=Thiohalocapsa sp. TaxID=2497641 RepID=UPI0025DC69AB|nr:deoxyribodipyrimidine photo-lyase [Thiohalocapsa sp.]MCG6941141.1 DNA photolyase family protein [Thiohalocapsa sp.]
MSTPRTAIVWFRRDLRLADNPALATALERCAQVIPVYIHAPGEEAPWQPGGASRWWLHHGLTALAADLADAGSRLVVAQGESLSALRRLIQATGAVECHWNRLYEPATIARDTAVKQALRGDGLHCDSHNAAMLFEPWTVQTTAGEPYRVFSPYWRQCAQKLTDVAAPLPAPGALPPVPAALESLPIDALGLLPRIRWDQGLADTWQPGAAGAAARLRRFLGQALDAYGERRDLPGEPGTSQLSPHLHWGEIGPRQVLAAVRDARADITAGGAGSFLRELGWREFSMQLLFHFPHTPAEPLDTRFAGFPWRTDGAEGLLEAWQRGQTGIPIVDAGMRELWHTGWMHNRVRMVVASLLTKNLRLPWQEGARWFWDTLVDADLANNTQGWQWTAGCGADAAPYFRIFNPVRQGERFDAGGDYVRRWCPELAALPERLIHQPWTAKPALLEGLGVQLGRDYPAPMVDLQRSRDEALAAYEQIKQQS